MKFVARNTRVTGGIEKTHKQIHQIEKIIFKKIIVGAVQPVNLVTADGVVMALHGIVANTGGMKLLVGIQRIEVLFQLL